MLRSAINLTTALVFVIAGMLLTSFAQAQPLLVDIGQSVGGTVTPEAGWNGFTANTSALVTNSYPSAFGTGGGGGNEVTVRITSPFYRSTPSAGYPQVTSQPGFNNLLSGSALMNDTSQIISLVLEDLTDGEYEITTYHHANFTNSTGLGAMDIFLSDANAANQLVHPNVAVTAGTTPPIVNTRNTLFEVSGGSPVTLVFDAVGGTSAPEHANLNAFQLNAVAPAVPEPSTFAIAIIGMLGFLLLVGRRRRR